MANINAQEMQDIKIMIPPAKLQDKYAQIVRSVRNKVASLSNTLNVSGELFSSIF